MAIIFYKNTLYKIGSRKVKGIFMKNIFSMFFNFLGKGAIPIEKTSKVHAPVPRFIKDGAINLKKVLAGKIPNVSYVKKGMGYEVTKNNPKTNTNIIYRVWDNGVVYNKKVILGEGNSASIAIKEVGTTYGNQGKNPMNCHILYKIPMFKNSNGAKVIYEKPVYPQNSSWQKVCLKPMNI